MDIVLSLLVRSFTNFTAPVWFLSILYFACLIHNNYIFFSTLWVLGRYIGVCGTFSSGALLSKRGDAWVETKVNNDGRLDLKEKRRNLRKILLEEDWQTTCQKEISESYEGITTGRKRTLTRFVTTLRGEDCIPSDSCIL
jgi:hypothetical protein